MRYRGPQGQQRSAGSVRYAKFAEYVAKVCLDGPYTEAEGGGDLLVAHALHEELKNLRFSAAQRVPAVGTRQEATAPPAEPGLRGYMR